jgi:diadenosine tetraphosphatase ApaH/serine/threonine PP2A family protein phosphatase
VGSLALLYDVHGNLPALEAVLDDAREVGIDTFLLGGDYALFGAWPEETVATLRGLEAVAWIRGICEREAAEAEPAPDNPVLSAAVAGLREIVDPSLIPELAALPEQAVHDGIRYCHASPISDMRSFLPEPGAGDEELAAGVEETRLVFGHTHLPFVRSGPRAIELVNPGSVGMPFDGDPRAAYALVHADGRLEHRRVAYDHEASAAAVRGRFGDADWVQTVARRIATARP